MGVFMSRWKDCSGLDLCLARALVGYVHLLATMGIMSDTVDCSLVGTMAFHGHVSAFRMIGLPKGECCCCYGAAIRMFCCTNPYFQNNYDVTEVSAKSHGHFSLTV